MRSWFASALALTASAGAIVAAQDVSRVSDAWGQQPPAPQPPQPQPAPQPQTPQIISRILVEGNQRIEARTVLSYLLVKPGDPFDQERIGLSVRALGGTGLFADIQIEARGNDLVVRVLENPIINRIMFEGNNAVTTEKLEEETEAEPRQTFTLSRVEQDVQRILEVYRRAGRFAATVTPQYKVLEQNRADLIFVIEEGPTTGVRSINFIGNEAFADDRLRREITTRQSRWWRFFEQADNYNPGQVEYDRSQLTEFYTNEGYADFRVIASVAELTPDRRDFYLTFTVDEGEKYTFGDIKVETQLEKLSGERLSLVLGIQKGQQFRAKSIQDAIDTLTFAAGIAGYANVQIRPREVRDPVNHTIGITFQVDEGARVYVERIDIQGNTQTLDRVIRREIRVAEGDQYNPVQLDNAKNRIRALGFFKPDTVSVENEPGSTSDRAVVKVKVEEEATGELAFSAGFSSQDAFLFSVSAQQRNFRGRGQYLSARIQTTSRQQDIEFRFTEPKFQDRNMALGFDLFLTQSDFYDIAGFENSIVGVGGRLLFPLSDQDQIGLRYNLRSDDLTLDSDPNSATYTNCETTAFFRSSLCDQQGGQLTSAFGYTLTMNRTNDYINPTRGFDLNFSQDIAGLGGDVNYLRNEFRGSMYHGFAPGWTLTGRMEAGYIDSWGDEGIRINNRFFKGGNSFRGFDVAGLGPREVRYYYDTEEVALDVGVQPPEFSVPQLNTDGTQVVNDAGQLLYQTAARDASGNLLPSKVEAFNALGGKAYAIGSLELSFPIPYAPEELGIDGAFFTEFGTLGLLDDADRDRRADSTFEAYRVDDSASLRASAGVSIFWDSPFGPIRFDFSQILAKEEYDKTESFRFSTNTRF
ncbi:MAG: outer membrane protein assembly factor BamA [Hyphomonadaceae bacterium]|nr:outer membrane protein assembly factor BamA [Hyphomonadaceae bacterium]